MSYSVYFFASDSAALAQRLKSEPDLTERTLQHIQQKASPSANDLELLAALLRAGLSGNWPHDESTDAFQAFCWLLDLLTEPIRINDLRGFRSISILEGTELWLHFTKHHSPFPVPTSGSAIPRIGFIPAAALPEIVRKENSHSRTIDSLSRASRTELLEVMESLGEESLDLFAILM